MVVAPDLVNAGRPVTVNFRVTNVGDSAGSYEVPMLLDGDVAFTAIGTLPARASRGHATTVTSSVPGTHIVHVGDLVESFIVRGPTIQFSNLTVGPKTVGPGDPVTVGVSVANTGGAPGTYEATLAVGGTTEAVQRGALPPDREKNLAFSVVRQSTGTYSISVGGLSSSFTVVPPALDTAVEVPSEVTIGTEGTGLDANNNVVTSTGDNLTIEKTDEGIVIQLPVGLAEGVGLDSFEDAVSGVRVDGNTVEIPLARDADGNVTLRLIAETDGVVGTGTTATATATDLRLVMEDQEVDLSADDPALGQVSFSIDADLKQAPQNANLTVTPKKQLPPDARAGFELVARGNGNTITNVGAAIQIDHLNLDNVTDVGEVRIYIAVSPAWVAANGGVDAIQITRFPITEPWSSWIPNW